MAWAIKPQIDISGLETRLHSADDDSITSLRVELVTLQRFQDNQKPTEERVGIGGEVLLTIMEPSILLVRPIHRFDDYEANYQVMLQNAGLSNEG